MEGPTNNLPPVAKAADASLTTLADAARHARYLAHHANRFWQDSVRQGANQRADDWREVRAMAAELADKLEREAQRVAAAGQRGSVRRG